MGKSLSKSRFIELFGTVNDNVHKYEVCSLGELVDINIGLTHTPKYTETGIPFLSVKDISSGKIDLSNVKFISKEEFNSLPKGAKPQPGDLLFCRVGTLGKPVIVSNEIGDFGTFVSLGYLRFSSDSKVIQNTIKCWMNSDLFDIQVRASISGASQPNLNTGWLKKFKLVVPPIEIQNEFANFVNQIDKLKFILQKMIEKLELLKKSRFVEMFGDPVLNPYKLKKDSFRHICEELFAGGDKPSDIVLTKDETHPYPVYANGYENLGFMGFSSQCRVNKPAITISARGTIGFSCIRQAGFTPIVRLLTLIPKTGIDLDYLKFAIDFYSFTSSGTSQKQLTVPDIAKYEVLVPDYSSQQCFATFVHQLDKLKLILQKQLEDLVGETK